MNETKPQDAEPTRPDILIGQPHSEDRAGELQEITHLTIFQIDDDPSLHEMRRDDMKRWGCAPECELGSAQSVKEALQKIRTLAESGKSPRIILLDQKFFEENEDEIAAEAASRKFVTSFAEMQKDSILGPVLKDTKIIMVSGTDDDEYLVKMQKICPAVIGRAPKGNETGDIIASFLAEQGVVKPNEVTNAAQRRTIHHHFVAMAQQNIGRKEIKELEADLKNTQLVSTAAMLLNGIVNALRRQVGEEPLPLTSPAFRAIATQVRRSDFIEDVQLSSELLLASDK